MVDLFTSEEFKKLEKQILEKDLSGAVEDLKKDIEEDLERSRTISYDEVNRELDRREESIKQGMRQASLKAGKANEKRSELRSRKQEDEFKKDLRDNAVDKADFEKAWRTIKQQKQVISEFALMMKILLDDRQVLRDSIDVQERRANESQIMENIKDFVENQQVALENQKKEMAEDFSKQLERIFDEKIDAVEADQELAGAQTEAANALTEATNELEKLVVEVQQEREVTSPVENSSTADAENQPSEDGSKDREDLTEAQQKLYDLVEEKPEKGAEYYAEELDVPVKIVKMRETKIQKRGYEDFSLD